MSIHTYNRPNPADRDESIVFQNGKIIGSFRWQNYDSILVRGQVVGTVTEAFKVIQDAAETGDDVDPRIVALETVWRQYK